MLVVCGLRLLALSKLSDNCSICEIYQVWEVRLASQIKPDELTGAVIGFGDWPTWWNILQSCTSSRYPAFTLVDVPAAAKSWGFLIGLIILNNVGAF